MKRKLEDIYKEYNEDKEDQEYKDEEKECSEDEDEDEDEDEENSDEEEVEIIRKNAEIDIMDLTHFFPFQMEGISFIQPRTKVELNMNKLSGTIRNKPNWHLKYQNPEILNKWKQEVGTVVTDKEWNYIIKELDYYKSLIDPTNGMQVAAIDGVWQSDSLIPENLKEKFILEVDKLKSNTRKDWHPNSNDQVLDIVHPSLYCVVNCVTPILKVEKTSYMDLCFSKNESEMIHLSSQYAFRSKDFQWIPSEFHVSNGVVTIKSYINNLEPLSNNGLYRSIENIFSRFLPLFEKTLIDLINPPKNERVAVDPFDWYPPRPTKEKIKQKKNEDEDGEKDGEEEVETEEFDDDDDWYENRIPITPQPLDEFVPPIPPSKIISLKNRNLQVITELSDIILTPDKPDYPGGVWHVEGMLNERIVASGIYYYHSENITESYLSFRSAVSEPEYEQSDDKGVAYIYGLANDEPLNQGLGSIETKTDRCIVFPNYYQHKVEPFSLDNKEKMGIRRILVFFLVDPFSPIISTARVPPQREEFWEEIIKRLFPLFPVEVVKKIANYCAPVTFEEAENFRLELMDERKQSIKLTNDEFFERPFSLCEH